VERSGPTTWGARLIIGFLSLLLLCGGYYGLYRLAVDDEYLLGVDPIPSYICNRWHSNEAGWYCVDCFFRPAYLIDRELRPEFWRPFRDEYDFVGRAGRK
jgi:hypothetical protein